MADARLTGDELRQVSELCNRALDVLEAAKRSHARLQNKVVDMAAEHLYARAREAMEDLEAVVGQVVAGLPDEAEPSAVQTTVMDVLAANQDVLVGQA